MPSRLLHEALQHLAATGSAGFEGLIQRLLADLTGYKFYLAKSGSQLGRDMSSDRANATVLAVECKRYGDDTELKARELLGELAQAVEAIPKLDVWVLVASREVPDQLYGDLQCLADRLNVDVQIVALGKDSAGSLELLCAHSPDIVMAALQVLEASDACGITEELERVRAGTEFSRRCAELKTQLTRTSGFDAARQGLHAWLRGQFLSETQSRVALGQPVDVDSKRAEGLLVPRTDASAEFDRWLNSWPESRTRLAVLGEEGDGKTWAVASWLSGRLSIDASFPPTLWISAQEATDQNVDCLLSAALAKRLGGRPEAWRARLLRWVTPMDGDGPVLLLVLDGINERRDASWWRPLIESLGSDIWRGAVATVVTSRTGFWPSVGRFPHSRFSESVVPAYNDRELALAIEQRGIQREELPDDILPLVRKPRYLELALRHRVAMAESGDVTVARLVYEDWRDRETRRAGLPSESAFQRAIMALAAKYGGGSRGLASRDVLDAVAGVGDDCVLLRELETSGILTQNGRRWRVDPSRLALGFGLLLVERLCDEVPDAAPTEVVASWMEPQPGIDLKAKILEHATLHALRTSDCPSEIRRLLLVAWLTHRNQAEPTGHSVAAYFPLDPKCYLNAAESIWCDETNDGWAEELLKATYSRWAAHGDFAAHFASAFGRWLGFVHVDRSPIGTDPERRASRRTGMREILGRDLSPGPFDYAGIGLVAIDDEGLLRLGRLALAIISDVDRRPFVSALTTAYLAEALMQHPDRLDLCSWIIRTSQVDLWPLLEPDVRRFIQVGSRPALQAAYRLLGSIGTARARELRGGLPEGLFPIPQSIRDLETDPCVSWFAWRSEDCARCAEREDVPTHIVAQNLARCVRDPGFVVPPAAVRRLNDMLESVDPSKMWCGVSTTEQEHRFETLELALASGDPAGITRTVRAIARDLRVRRGLPLRQAGYELSEYRLALSASEVEAVREVWDSLRALGSAADQETERAEYLLFELLLPRLSAAEQLDCLLARHPDALLLTHFRRQFKPLPWSAVAQRLQRTMSDGETSRILFFAAANPDCVDESAAADLAGYVESSDRLVRLSALRLIYTSGLESAADVVVGGEWHFDGQTDDAVHEDHWGSLLLARWGQRLPYDELRTRVMPTYLGRAVAARGFDSDEVRRYAEDLDRVWVECGAGGQPMREQASMEVRAPAGRSDEIDLPGVPQSAFSRTLTFFTRHASWGGAPDQASPAEVMNRPTDEDLKALQDDLRQTLSEQRRARNEWFAHRFSLDCLPEVLAAKPGLVRRWIGDPIGKSDIVTTRAWFGRSFYESLCEVLLSEDPTVGIELSHWLRHQSPAVNFVERLTDVPLLDHALFRAKDCLQLRAVWDSYLDAARSDRDLLVLAVLAESGSASGWLADRLATDLMSAVPLRKTRAVILGGFVGGESAPIEPVPSDTDVVEWQRDQHERAVQNWRMNQWAQRWFVRFTSAESDEIALGAFRLFLACVDSRFLLWRNAALTELPEDRRRFLSSTRDRIERAIRKNEEGHRKHFLGMRVVDRQVWPWT